MSLATYVPMAKKNSEEFKRRYELLQKKAAQVSEQVDFIKEQLFKLDQLRQEEELCMEYILTHSHYSFTGRPETDIPALL